MTTRRQLALLAPALTLVACSGEATTLGFDEPIRVKGAQFFEGQLPGTSPLTAEDVNAGVQPTKPNVGAVTVPNTLIPVDEPARNISGNASLGSSAVAVRFADAGSGYWLVPTTNADVLNPGVVEWRMQAAFDNRLSPGLHRLLFAALDEQGRSGTQGELNLCLAPELPDNGNSCDPTVSPPALIISLSWDAPVDLDLRVITPSGNIVDSKHPSTAVEDENGDFDPNAEGVGIISHDAVAHCLAQGRRRENLVFQTTPPAGTYLVYANLYDACGEPGVHFDASLHIAVGSEDGTFAPKQTYHQPGQLDAVHANGGAKLGMFITSFVAH